jgi:hypothetical protein
MGNKLHACITPLQLLHKVLFLLPFSCYKLHRLRGNCLGGRILFRSSSLHYVHVRLCTALSMSSIEGAFIVSKNTSEGKGSLCAADLANKSACSFPFLQKIPRKKLPIFGLHPNTFQASDLLPCYSYPRGQK